MLLSKKLWIWTGTETFAKEPEFAQLLRRLKSTPVLNNKKSSLVFSYVCNGKFSVFWVLYCGITCKWVLFSTIELYFYCIDRWKVYNRLVFMCTVKTAIEVKCLCVSTSKNSTLFGLVRFSLYFCLSAPQLIGSIKRLELL